MSPSRRWQLCRNLAPGRVLAGMRVEHISPDLRAVTVALRPRWYRGGASHTGAALYTMVDPFLQSMVQHAVGADYLVWDKAGSIDMLAAARGRVWARLELKDDDVHSIRQMTQSGDKHLHLFAVDVRDADGMLIARIEKMIYVRRKGDPT